MTGKSIWNGEVGETIYKCPWCDTFWQSLAGYAAHAYSFHGESVEGTGTVTITDINVENGVITVRSTDE